MKQIAVFYTCLFLLAASFTIGVMIGHQEGVEMERINHIECEALPVDNKLIRMNDSLYYRVNVRVDTTFFHPGQ